MPSELPAINPCRERNVIKTAKVVPSIHLKSEATNPFNLPSLVFVDKFPKIESTKLNVNTKTTMEYLVYSIGGSETNNAKWTATTKNMKLSQIAPNAIYSDKITSPQDVVLAIRYSETERKPYSKTTYVTIPAQRKAPDTVVESNTSSTYMLSFGDASEDRVYQYSIVKPNTTWNESKASFRTVKKATTIVLKSSKYPEGTKIYVRLKGVDETSKYSPVLPSVSKEYKVTYTTNTTN